MMAAIIDWIDRLFTLDIADETPTEAHSTMYRLVSTSRLNFDDSVIRIEDSGISVPSFGSEPAHMSVLHFWDVGGQNPYRDQLVGTQLVALLTLAMRRRVRVASGEITLRMEGSSTTTFMPASIVDRELLGPATVDPKESFETLLRAVVGLSTEHRDPILSAIELHYSATQLYDIDLTTAHTLLVAAIETLAGHFEPLQSTWKDFIDADHWDEVFADIELASEQASRLRSELLADRHFKLRQRFVS